MIEKRKDDESPHYIAPDEGCMGYWRQFLICRDGRCVCGIGASEDEAIENADKARKEHEDLAYSSCDNIIRTILNGSKERNHIFEADLPMLLRAMAIKMGIDLD